MAEIRISDIPVKEYKLIHADTPAQQYAADELCSYFSKICGEIPAGNDDSHTITLEVNPEELVHDGYRMANAGGKLVITGGSERGLLYGVYAFLENKLGVRFFMPDTEELGNGGNIGDFEEAFNPPFEFRQSDWVCGNDLEWSVKNRINNRACPEKLGGYVKWGGFVHTMHDILGTDYDKQPCLSDPANLERAIAYVHKRLKGDPSINIVSVSQNDNQNYCKCPKCAAVDAEEGSHMGTLLRFVNGVADSIKDEYPDVAIDTLAYQYTRNVPHITKPRDNVNIRLCSIECCFSHPLSDNTCERNAAFIRDIEEWNKICHRLYIWDYVTDFSYYIPTFPNFGVLRENMHFFAQHGVTGMYPEGNYNTNSGEFGELRCYLLAKLMYDPNMSETEYQRHMDEFLAGYYGEGWRYIRAYLDLAVSACKRVHMSIWSNPFDIIDRATYEALYDTIDAWWDQAEALAGDKLDHVKKSRLQWTYIALMVRPDAEKGKAFFEEVKARNINFNEWRKTTKEPDFSLPTDKWDF